MKILIFIGLVILFSCNFIRGKAPKKNLSNLDSKNRIEDTIVALDGAWFKNLDENAELVIRDSKIKGTDEGMAEWYEFKLKHDTVIIDYGDNIFGKNIIIKISKDSLVLKYEDGSVVRLFKEVN